MIDNPTMKLTVEVSEEFQQRLAEIQGQIDELRSSIEVVRLNNPYGIACFTPVSDEDWNRLNELLQREFGHTTDRYAAAVMRHAWDACARQIAVLAGIE